MPYGLDLSTPKPSLLGGIMNFAGSPWGKALGIGLGFGGALWGASKAPNELDMARQKMAFVMKNLGMIPGLAGQFRDYMLRGSGAEQGNLIGASQAYTSDLRRRLAALGMGGTTMGSLTQSMGQSMLGQSVANMFNKYNQGGFDMANQDIMGGLGMSFQGNQNLRNQLYGGILGAGSNLLDRTLYPRRTT